MHKSIITVADGFWNVRGSYKIGGILDVGTHASLIRRKNGKFLFLDSYTLSEPVKRDLDEITSGGKDVEAILNVHPFHTVHVRTMHGYYPHAKLYGTSRHLSRFPDMPWQPSRIEEQAAQADFADDLDFSVPRGVDLVSANENVHFSSVLVLHRATKTIHVDDTLTYFFPPFPLSAFMGKEVMTFHMTLAKALERRPGAARDFRHWARELAEQWRDAENLCAAHSANLLARTNAGAPIRERILAALDKVEKKLAAHERAHG